MDSDKEGEKMKIKCSYDDLVDINTIKEHPRNVNEHPEIQLKGLEETLKSNGIRIPLIVSNLSGNLISGHARYLVMKKMGVEMVPVVYQNFEDEKEEFRVMVAINEASRRSWLNPEKFDLNLGQLGFGKDYKDRAFGIFKEFKLETKGDDVNNEAPKLPSDDENILPESPDGDVPPGVLAEEEPEGHEERFKVMLNFKREDYRVFLKFIDAERVKHKEELEISDIIINAIENNYF